MGFFSKKKKEEAEKLSEEKEQLNSAEGTVQANQTELAGESQQELLNRLASNAGGIIEMLKNFFKKPQGIDIQMSLLFAAGLAGYACHQAVLAEKGSFQVVTTKDGKKYYFGDDVNKYALENATSVYSFVSGISEMPQQEMLAIVKRISETIGTEQCQIWGMEPGSVYTQIKACWEGIYNNMTAKYCQSPSEWPVLYGIVLQNIIAAAMQVGPKEEIRKMAMECVIMISKMDEDSL